MGSEQVFATQVEYDALAHSVALPIVLDQAEVSVGAGFGLAEVSVGCPIRRAIRVEGYTDF
jgi:hypothetical protein